MRIKDLRYPALDAKLRDFLEDHLPIREMEGCQKLDAETQEQTFLWFCRNNKSLTLLDHRKNSSTSKMTEACASLNLTM